MLCGSVLRAVRLVRHCPSPGAASSLPSLTCTPVRHINKDVRIPKPGAGGIQYRYRVELPEKYTIKRLPIQKLGGRDPVTGRVVVGTLGGGSKQKYRWVDNQRPPLEDGSPRQERVLQINYDPLRTCMIALVAHGDHLRWIISHQGMQVGDIVTTYGDVPRIPVRPKTGDSHPVGALPAGTEIFNVEQYHGEEERFCIAGGTFAVVLRKVGDRVIIQNSKKRQYSIKQECTCTVGRVQTRVPAIYPIGSAWRLRWLGKRPRSGLWQRKTGRFGRKLRRPPPVRELNSPPPPAPEVMTLTLRDVYVQDSNSENQLFVPGRGMRN